MPCCTSGAKATGPSRGDYAAAPERRHVQNLPPKMQDSRCHQVPPAAPQRQRHLIANGVQRAKCKVPGELGGVVEKMSLAHETRIGDLWCRLMHAEPMWPAHGHYECRTCGRRFPVFWDQAAAAIPAMVLSLESQATISLAAGRL
jgi:hypothetical protein